MKKYILGLLKFFFQKNISLLAKITPSSKISKKATINRFAKVYNSTVDDYTYIGIRTELVEAEIGKFCSIASNCNIGLAKHTLDFLSTSPLFTERYNATGYQWAKKDFIEHNDNKVIIGNDVWIGNKATILSNVRVGNGAVIGAGAIVTRDVPDYAIVAGIPAKIIKYRFPEDTVKMLLEIKWWNISEDILKKNIYLFQKNEIDVEGLMKITNNKSKQKNHNNHM